MALIILMTAFLAAAQALTLAEDKTDPCRTLQSCSSCLSKNYCTWCVNKSLCTRNSCGNDNVIYPNSIQALMTGERFCPRVVEPEKPLIFKSGDGQDFEVKLTQLYIFMAFTKFQCRISIAGREEVVNAMIVSDTVYCDEFALNNDSVFPEVDGIIEVLWDGTKKFDGSVLFKVCRCDLDTSCVACRNKQKE